MNALDVLKYGHATILQTLEGFPDEAWEEDGACGAWSVKDIVSHLASFEHVLVDVLYTFFSGESAPYLTRFTTANAAFNDSEVILRREKSAQEVLAEYNETHGQVMALAARLPAESFRQSGTLPWYGSEYSLDDFIVYTFYGHKREHCAQIAVFRDHLK